MVLLEEQIVDRIGAALQIRREEQKEEASRRAKAARYASQSILGDQAQMVGQGYAQESTIHLEDCTTRRDIHLPERIHSK